MIKCRGGDGEGGRVVAPKEVKQWLKWVDVGSCREYQVRAQKKQFGKDVRGNVKVYMKILKWFLKDEFPIKNLGD